MSHRQELSQAIFEEVRAFCVAKADPEQARRYARYFKEGYDAYGLDYRDPEWVAKQDTWAKRLRAASPSAFLDAGDLLVATGKYEEATCAFFLARQITEADSAGTFARLGQWFDKGIGNWAHSDAMCGDVLPRFFVKGITTLNDVTPWVRSPFKYKRRAAAVLLIKPFKSGHVELAAALKLLEPLMGDTERVVHQGMGWFLREAWKKEPRPVDAYLLRYKDSAARTIYQYATEKMDKAARERFRKTKSRTA